MRYCVVKDTLTIIDGSLNSNEIMIKNALECGYNKNQIEVLTEEEYQNRILINPRPIPKTEMELIKEKQEMQDKAILELSTLIGGVK